MPRESPPGLSLPLESWLEEGEGESARERRRGPETRATADPVLRSERGPCRQAAQRLFSPRVPLPSPGSLGSPPSPLQSEVTALRSRPLACAPGPPLAWQRLDGEAER